MDNDIEVTFVVICSLIHAHQARRFCVDEPTTVCGRLKATVVVLCSFQVEDKRPCVQIIHTDRLQPALITALKEDHHIITLWPIGSYVNNKISIYAICVIRLNNLVSVHLLESSMVHQQLCLHLELKGPQMTYNMSSSLRDIPYESFSMTKNVYTLLWRSELCEWPFFTFQSWPLQKATCPLLQKLIMNPTHFSKHSWPISHLPWTLWKHPAHCCRRWPIPLLPKVSLTNYNLGAMLLV